MLHYSGAEILTLLGLSATALILLKCRVKLVTSKQCFWELCLLWNVLFLVLVLCCTLHKHKMFPSARKFIDQAPAILYRVEGEADPEAKYNVCFFYFKKVIKSCHKYNCNITISLRNIFHGGVHPGNFVFPFLKRRIFTKFLTKLF